MTELKVALEQLHTELTAEKLKENMQIKAIIFDFGGVLNTSNDIEGWRKGFKDLGAKNEISMDKEPFKTLITDQALGKFASDEEFLKKLRELLAMPADVSNKAVVAAWNSQAVGFNNEFYKIAGYKKKFKIFALSNTNKLHRDHNENVQYPEYLQKYSDKGLTQTFRGNFDKVYCSNEIHLRKPDPKAWELILKENPDLQPQNCIFVDDIKDYVDAAVKLGMHAFHFDIDKHSLDDVIKYIEKVNQAAFDVNSKPTTFYNQTVSNQTTLSLNETSNGSAKQKFNTSN